MSVTTVTARPAPFSSFSTHCEAFLAWLRSLRRFSAQHGATALPANATVIAVLPNEACDLDSVITSIAYAFALHCAYNGTTAATAEHASASSIAALRPVKLTPASSLHSDVASGAPRSVIVMPVLPIAPEDLALRGDSLWALRRVLATYHAAASNAASTAAANTASTAAVVADTDTTDCGDTTDDDMGVVLTPELQFPFLYVPAPTNSSSNVVTGSGNSSASCGSSSRSPMYVNWPLWAASAQSVDASGETPESPAAMFRVCLTDHNRPTVAPFTSLPSHAVLSVIDHHLDEGMWPLSHVRAISTAGSASSVLVSTIAQQLRVNAYDSALSTPLDLGDASGMSAESAVIKSLFPCLYPTASASNAAAGVATNGDLLDISLALGDVLAAAIITDTINLSVSAGKVTVGDCVALSLLGLPQWPLFTYPAAIPDSITNTDTAISSLSPIVVNGEGDAVLAGAASLDIFAAATVAATASASSSTNASACTDASSACAGVAGIGVNVSLLSDMKNGNEYDWQGVRVGAASQALAQSLASLSSNSCCNNSNASGSSAHANDRCSAAIASANALWSEISALGSPMAPFMSPSNNSNKASSISASAAASPKAPLSSVKPPGSVALTPISPLQPSSGAQQLSASTPTSAVLAAPSAPPVVVKESARDAMFNWIQQRRRDTSHLTVEQLLRLDLKWVRAAITK